jgi:hypothetical protein
LGESDKFQNSFVNQNKKNFQKTSVMLPSNLSNIDEGKALKARLYKKYESGSSQKTVF